MTHSDWPSNITKSQAPSTGIDQINVPSSELTAVIDAPCAIATISSANTMDEIEGSRLIDQRGAPSETDQADAIPSVSPAMKDSAFCAMVVTEDFRDLTKTNLKDGRYHSFYTSLSDFDII